MSRSNPTNNNPNPSTRWFEWKGSTGKLVWYNKETKESVAVPNGFRFIVLDQLAKVTGYNKKAKSGIHSNEVRDTRKDILTVKFFSGDSIAEGLWAQIKEKVAFAKGGFATSCYIAYAEGSEMKIANICFSGCSLGPWFDFVKKHRADLDKKAVVIKAGEKDTSGSVDFIPPTFSIVEISDNENECATDMDRQLQKFLAGYLARAKSTDEAPNDEPEGASNSPDEGEPDTHGYQGEE